ncbi:MAG: hypothetical protein ACU0CO_12005 [Shimia sp.]
MTQSPIKDAILASDIRQLFEFARYLERTLQIAYPEGDGYVKMRAGEFIEHIVDWADPDMETEATPAAAPSDEAVTETAPALETSQAQAPEAQAVPAAQQVMETVDAPASEPVVGNGRESGGGNETAAGWVPNPRAAQDQDQDAAPSSPCPQPNNNGFGGGWQG